MFYDAEVSFDVAQGRCKALSINGYTKFELVSINNDAEAVFVRSLATQQSWESGIGLKRATSQRWSDFMRRGKWTDGGNILKQDWENGHPPSGNARVSIIF